MRKSIKFIQSVNKNLPSPEQSGPKTENGKKKVRYNALKHGLSVNGFLPCNPNRCIYKQHICDYQELDFFTDLCIIELAKYLYLKESFSYKTNSSDPTIQEAYIICIIRIERANRYIAINPDVIWDEKFYKTLFRLHRKIIKLSVKIKEEENGYEKKER